MANWNKYSAISGWVNAAIAAIGIGVMLWLGLRPPSPATNVASVQPGGLSVMQWWVPWGAASLYLVGVMGAAILHFKAARKQLSPSTSGIPNGFVPREEYERMMRSNTSHETVRDELKRQLSECKTELATSLSETQTLREAGRVFQEELSRIPALTIHSAVYGAGHVGREDLSVSPDRLRTRNALAMRVQNSALVPRDPADVPKRLIVRYSFENAEIQEAVFEEGELMILPEPQSVRRLCTAQEWLRKGEQLKLIANRHFTFEDVVLDGHNFVRCTFEHVKLFYDGIAPTALRDCTFDDESKTHLHTHNPAIDQWIQIIRAYGIFGDDFIFGIHPVGS